MSRLGRALGRLVGRRPAGPAPGQAQGVDSLKLRYQEFKGLLRANNEVLALIAEIEQRLAEGSGVGVDFIRSRYIEASAKVFKMILHLGRISGEAYPGLTPAFNLVRASIDDLLARVGRPEEEALILPLDQVDRDMAHLVGSKAANLAHLRRAGLPAPDGFAITAQAFHLLINATGLREAVNQEVMFLEDLSYHNLSEMSRRIEARFLATALPPELTQELAAAQGRFFARLGREVNLSFRSSAVGEDTEASFAGQYRSVLNVPLAETRQAYAQVAASLYEPQAVVYRRRRGLRDEDAEMAVLVLEMLRPTVSGVMYTRDPRQGEGGPILINAVHGVGRGLVEGRITPDVYALDHGPEPGLIKAALTDKGVRLVLGVSGLEEEALPPELRGQPSLSTGQAKELARLGLKIEALFGEPQDVEWCYVPERGFLLLQARPLQLVEDPSLRPDFVPLTGPLLLSGGQTARPGAGSGPAYPVREEEDLDAFPAGGVLVAAKSSPVFACVLGRAAAVVTEIGGVTGHMASLAREFGVPTIVGARGALAAIPPGQEVTVDATMARVYQGRLAEVVGRKEKAAEKPRACPLGLTWYRAAMLITPLTLTDPRSPDFKPEKCATYHDLIRFIHEKSFTEMFRLGDSIGRAAGREARKLSERLPFDLWLIDLGGAFAAPEGREIAAAQVASAPTQAFFEGLLDGRIKWDQPRPVSLRGMASVLSSSLFTPVSDGQVRDMGEKAFAIVSPTYLNFNSRVGYHFAALDSVCGPVLNDNYVSFRFQGGAATTDRRTLRAELIAEILGSLGFEVRQEADRVQAFLKKLDETATAQALAALGRLTLFTRQMDMLVHDRRMVGWLVEAFRSGNYNLDHDGRGPTVEAGDSGP